MEDNPIKQRAQKFLEDNPDVTADTLHNLKAMAGIFHQSAQQKAAFNEARHQARLAIEVFERNHPDIVHLAALLSEYDDLQENFAMYEIASIGPRYHASITKEVRNGGH